MPKNNRNTLKDAIKQLAQYHNIRDSSNIYRTMVYDAVYDNAIKEQAADVAELTKLAAGQAAIAAAQATLASTSFDSLVDAIVQFTDEAESFVPYGPKKPAGAAEAPPEKQGFLKNFAENIESFDGGPPDFVKKGISFYGNFGVSRVGADVLGKIKDFMLLDPTKNNIKTMIFGKNEGVIDEKLIDGNGAFGTKSPNISITTMQGPWLTRNVVDSGAVALFMNGLPATEISQAVPYFDAKIINSKQANFKIEGDKVFPTDGLSIVKFVQGFGEADKEDEAFLRANSKDPDVPVAIVDGGTAPGQGTDDRVFSSGVAGMELFTMPQTYTSKHETYIDLNRNGLGESSDRENAILDTFRPLMTIRDFKYSVDMSNVAIPTIRGTLNLTLHDRSRLQEISPLIRPDKARGLQMLIEFGWSHPRQDSPYGLLINACKIKRKFVVYGADYTFESNGSVAISINLISAGADAISEDLPSASAAAKGAMDPYDAIQGIVDSLSEILRGKGKVLTDLNDTVPWGKFTNMGDILTIKADALGKIKTKVDALITAESKPDIGNSDVKSLLEDINKEIGNATTQLAKYREAVKAYWTSFEKYVNDSAADDPFADQWPAILALQTANNSAFNKDKHISLGRLISILTIPSIVNHQAYDSIDFHYHRVNPDAYGLSLFPTIASLPVAKTDYLTYFKSFLKRFPNPPMALAIEHTMRFVVEYKAGNSGWGLGGASSATINSKGEIVVKKAKSKSAGKAEYKNRMTKASNHYYKSLRKMVNPQLRMEAEALPIQGDETKTCLRISIYDAADNAYRTYNDVLRAATTSAVGVISKIQTEAADDKLPDITAPEIKSLERLVSLGILTPINPPSKDPPGAPSNKEFLKNIANYKLAFTDPMQLRWFLSTSMPTIKYGTEHTVIKSAQVSATMDSELGIIQMAEEQKAADRPAGEEADDAIPWEIFPATLTLETLGCPIVRHGQQFFFDYQTNTTIDNIYIVSGIEHNLTPNSYTTSLKLVVVGRYGTFDSIANKLNQLQSAINSVVED